MPVTREQLAERISAIEGLTAEERSALLTMLRERKRYGLVWEDKPEKAEADMQESLPVLTEVTERAIVSPHTDAPNHVLIEGDNLHALTTLCYTHEGRIDVIYIDPPYNTGNKDFVYNDDFVDPEDPYRHSKWLSFMNKRLKIAKQLLSDRGVIFISIDDNEVAQLKMLCEEIFLEKNSFGVLVWDLGTGTSAGHFTRSHEYLLAYCNKKEALPNFASDEVGEIIDDRAVKKESAKNKKFAYSFNKGTRFEAEDGTEFTRVWGGTEKTELLAGRFICKDNQLAEDITLAACWTQKKQMDSFFAGEDTFDTKGQRVIEFYFRKNGKLYCRKEKETVNPPSVLRSVATTKQGSKILSEIFGSDESVFSFAKPVELIKYILHLFGKSATILDFFAGSGTTLHATMQLNAEDEGQRQCIIVTNNENSICERVTYERNRRVIQGYTTPKGVEVQGLEHNTLRYYRTDFVEREPSPRNMRRLMAMATDMLCIKHDIYTEEPVICGRRLRRSAARHFTRSDKRMLVIYDEQAIVPIVELLSKEDDSRGLIVYVFAPDSYAYDELFDSIRQRVTLCALPAAIYRVYRRILGRRKPKSQTTEPFIHD